MYLRLVLSIALVASVTCKDLEQGQNATEARKIFDEKREASPAVWRQVDKVTVNTTDTEVISRVVVTDLRPDKDGEASIVDGGEGNQTVTIELKSPTVLRGYTFQIEVYAVPDYGHVSTPAHVGDDKPKDSKNELKPKDDSGLNVGEFKPPSNFGPDSTTKPPVPLSTDLKVNDDKRITRDTEEKKVDTGNHDLKINDGKKTSEFEGKKEEAENHPITFVDPKEALKIIPNPTDKPQKDIEVSPHLPTTAGDTKQKDDHARYVRDTAKQTSTTQAPSTNKAVKDLKDDFPEMIYPQSHIDKMGNTDKMLIPVEPLTHDTKEVKTEKDNLSTTSTLKPRAVRDTQVTTPKTDVKDKPQDDRNIQKIPADGHVTVPKEWSDFQNKNATKTGLDKSEESKTPLPLFPSFNQDAAKNGPSFNQDVAKNGPSFNQDAAKNGPSFNQDAAKNGPSFNQDAAKNGPSFNQDAAKNGPSFNQDAAKNFPSFNHDAAKNNNGFAKNGPSFNQDSAKNGPSFNQDSAKNGPSFSQDSAKNGPSVSTTAKPKVGPLSSDESDSSEEDKKPVSFY